MLEEKKSGSSYIIYVVQVRCWPGVQPKSGVSSPPFIQHRRLNFILLFFVIFVGWWISLLAGRPDVLAKAMT